MARANAKTSSQYLTSRSREGVSSINRQYEAMKSNALRACSASSNALDKAFIQTEPKIVFPDPQPT